MPLCRLSAALELVAREWNGARTSAWFLTVRSESRESSSSMFILG